MADGPSEDNEIKDDTKGESGYGVIRQEQSGTYTQMDEDGCDADLDLQLEDLNIEDSLGNIGVDE